MANKKLRQNIKKLIPKQLFNHIEQPAHLLESVAYSTKEGFPAKKMRFIGVTGTNGKTTTANFIFAMMKEAGYKVALLSSTQYGFMEGLQDEREHMSTVPVPMLQKRLKQFAEQGAEWVVIEVTSHALAQHRVWGINFEMVVMTNVTHEHLDYHRTFDNYLKAKLKLFKMGSKSGKKLGIINADDPHADSFAKSIPNAMMYGLKNGDIKPSSVEVLPAGSKYEVDIAGTHYRINCPIPGDFNVMNSLAAVCVGHALGIPSEQIEKGIASLKYVEGRMNTIKLGQKYNVIIDFAHTPDAFERILSGLRKATNGKLVAVFGSAGRRDEQKRYDQGEIAAKYCDELVLTEEDDRDIDGEMILRQIAEGAAKSGKTAEKEVFFKLYRPDAIKFALTRVATEDDTVIFLGKGHEKTIERADGEHEWNETEEVTKAIKDSLV